MMNKSDFQSLALALNRTTRDLRIVQAVANACAASNPRFDRVTFLRAAGQEIAAQGLETLNDMQRQNVEGALRCYGDSQ